MANHRERINTLKAYKQKLDAHIENAMRSTNLSEQDINTHSQTMAHKSFEERMNSFKEKFGVQNNTTTKQVKTGTTNYGKPMRRNAMRLR